MLSGISIWQLLIVLVIIMLIFGIILLINAFQKSVWWGLGYLFVPFVGLVFVIMHWEMCKTPFLKMLVGAVIYAVGVGFLMPGMIKKAQEAQPQIEQSAFPTPGQ